MAHQNHMSIEPRITCFDRYIWQLEQPLTETLPLHVHLVVGDTAVLVDTGLSSTYPLIGQLLETAGVRPSDVLVIFNTHGHHDHIGSNRRLKADTGALGVQLEVLSVPGHVPAELAYYERATGSLIVGDAVTGIDWTFFHGHVQPAAYRASLRKLRAFACNNPINRALLAHYPLLDLAQFLGLLDRAEAYVDGLDQTILELVGASGPGGVDLETVWRTVCQRMSKQLEFRGLGMVDGHLRDLTARGHLARTAPDRYTVVPSTYSASRNTLRLSG
jgi:glyoxylase-like metal-dependent hydrolase (beta-lactamase superfamily II)